MMLQNHAWMKEPFKMQDRPMDFNITEYKQFIDIVSDSTLSLTFKKRHLSTFGVVSKRKATVN